MKSILMRVKTTRDKNGTTIITAHEAELKSENLSFQEVATFYKNIEKVNKILKSAIKTNAYTEFEVVTYDWDGNHINNYQHWYYTGYPEYDNCELDNGVTGYYLQPDTKYTPEHHDMVYDYTLESITA